MGIDVYLTFNGNCRQAINFYAEVFNVDKPTVLTWGEMPNPPYPLPEETQQLIMHASLPVLGSTLMMADIPPGRDLVTGNNISLTISSGSVEEITTLFHRLRVDGQVVMNLQPTFFSPCNGQLVDKFGITWIFVVSEPM